MLIYGLALLLNTIFHNKLLLELEDIINICLRIIITLIKESKNKIIKLLYLKKKIITVNRKILVMVLFWPILAPKYEVPKLKTPKYVTLQKLTAKIEHFLNIFLYIYSLVCTFLSYFFPK